MSNWPQKPRNDDSNDDKPPYSRLFIVCSKQTTADDLRTAFDSYGDIEDIYLPKDRNTGEPRGVAYIKYSKTSAAALAIEKRHLAILEGTNKTIKVMVASNKNMPSPSQNDNTDKYKRLFIKISREETEKDLSEYFAKFGSLESVHIQKSRSTDENRGFAYVNYKTFLDAAKAYEQCDSKYKAIFATPKEELKRSRTSLDSFNDSFHSHSSQRDGYNNYTCQRDSPMERKDCFSSLIKTRGNNYDSVIVTCSPPIHQKYLENLCNIIPNVISFKYTSDSYTGYCKAIVRYDNEKSAAFAVERLNHFEFPSGEVVTVKPDDNPLSKVANNLTNLVNTFKNTKDGNPDLIQLAEAMAEASNLIKAATVGKEDTNNINCSVPLPPVQPLADAQSRVAQRCFLVFKPHPPPLAVIKDAFCRFGNLIDICTFPNKTFGFAKYATVASAQEAMKTLHEATLNGIKVKVIEADEKTSKDSNNMDVDDEGKTEVKRKRFNRLDD